MAEAVIKNHAAFIWSVAQLLRGDYKQSEYGKVILPLVVLRRLDCVLEPTKAKVLAEYGRHGDREAILVHGPRRHREVRLRCPGRSSRQGEPALSRGIEVCRSRPAPRDCLEHRDGLPLRGVDPAVLGEDGAQLFDPQFPVAQIVRERCWVNDHAHVLCPTGIDSDLLVFYLNTFDRMPFISGSTRPKITQDDMSVIPVPAIGSDQQVRLRETLSDARRKTARLTEALERQIALLSERKQALITAAVTGQLDLAREIAEDAS